MVNLFQKWTCFQLVAGYWFIMVIEALQTVEYNAVILAKFQIISACRSIKIELVRPQLDTLIGFAELRSFSSLLVFHFLLRIRTLITITVLLLGPIVGFSHTITLLHVHYNC